MYLPFKTSKRRIREAENARKNRAEIVKALSQGQINRRDLFKWGLFTSAGLLLAKNGLSPFAQSAFAQVPTGIPRSPVGAALPYAQRLNRLSYMPPTPLTKLVQPNGEWEAVWPTGLLPEAMPNAKRLSWHTDFSEHPAGNKPTNPFINPITKRGPYEGRPPGEWFGHQRWKEFFPQVGYALAFGECAADVKFHPAWPDQEPNRLWPMYMFEGWGVKGHFPIPLLKGRYGEGIIMRAYNNLPVDRTNNGGFGRNEPSTHFHNAHNGAESDGASNAFHFPGTFYDYHWGTTLARHDMINRDATEKRASGPDGHGGLIQVPGDFRELQGTLWFHDHRFFFTSENVYKGMAAMMNYYSGPDRGNETLDDGVNLRLPSGSLLDYGNLDFDVNLFISDLGTDRDGQCRFDIFTTDGFVGDLLLVNQAWQPYMEVLPRKYRFRLINGSMSRFIQLCLADQNGNFVPFQFIANDGNFVVNPITLTRLEEQGTAERYDIVVDFSRFAVGDKVTLVNLLKQTDGRKPDGALSLEQALAQFQAQDTLLDIVDPAVGPIMQFRIVSEVESVDVPGHIHRASDPDPSRVPSVLTEQIPIVAPVRERHVDFGRSGSGDSRDPITGQCIPECQEPEVAPSFPWTIKVNGETAHSANGNRISLLIPKPGEVEHWTYQNGGGGWDHPIHLHFEEGVTMNRGNDSIPATENLVRKDVWRLRPSGSVKFQVRFGEYGGAYVNHCHNTVHEDFAMLLRYQVLTDKDNPKSSNVHVDIIPTPIPTPDGCTYMTPDVLAEGNPLGNLVTVSAAPVITSGAVTTAVVGQVYSSLVTATDANGDPLTYSLATAPAGMNIHATSGLISWTPGPGQVGPNDVTVRVADPKLLTATQSFAVTVSAAAAAPAITSTPILTAPVAVAYSYQVLATDPNGDILTYSLVAPIPAGMTIDPALGLLAWTPAAGQVGPNAVTVRATDPGGLFATQSFTIAVTAAAAAPVIISTPVLTAPAGVAYSYQVVATDVNGDILTYSLVAPVPTGMTINQASGVIAWTPAAGQVGPNAVTVRATDPGSLFGTQSFIITVASATTPAVTGFILRNATTDQLIGPLTTGTLVNLAACNNCQFNIEALVSGTGFNNVRLVLTGATVLSNNEGSFPYTMPGDSGVGSYNGMVLNQGAHTLTATPRTNTGATIGIPLTITFTVGSANAAPGAPVITSTAVTAGTVGVAYSYQVTATDVNGGPFTFGLNVAPAGMTISATGLISWIPATGQAGTNAVTVRVTDNTALSTTQSFSVTVAAAPAPTGPTVTGFVLRNANNDQVIGPLTNGTLISLAANNNCQFNIEALVSGTGFNNVRLVLAGATAHANNEGSFPYTKPGDGGVGSYNGMVLNQGAHSLTATPRTSTGATIGTPLTVNFTVGP